MTRIHTFLAAALLIATPSLSEAGPPLLCHPFQTADAPLLPWGSGPGWNTPSGSYDVRRLPDDLLRLLSADAPVLARMENIRRSVIYALEHPAVADQLMAALAARAGSTTGAGQALALFDAGYFRETYKQGVHRHHRTDVPDGYGMVLRAITMAGGNSEMEFAASLMTQGERAQSHRRRARAGLPAESLLAKNMDTLWR
jgi:hypothetical protein